MDRRTLLRLGVFSTVGTLATNLIGPTSAQSKLVLKATDVHPLGYPTVEAVLAGDFPTVQGVILLFSVSYVTVNLLIDLSYPLFDPRIRY